MVENSLAQIGRGTALAPEIQVVKKYINGNKKSVKKFNKKYFEFSQLALIKFGLRYEKTLFSGFCNPFEICIIAIWKGLLHLPMGHDFGARVVFF